MPLTPITGPLGITRAAHLLRRATFGPTKDQIDTFSALTADEAVAGIFQTGLPDPPLPVDLATGASWVISGTTDANSDDSTLEEYFKRWFIGQMLATGVDPNLSLSYSCREKITFFLHSHFTTIQSVVASSRSLYFQNTLFRQFAFDGIPDPIMNFKTLSKKICVDNAMLKFLDGRLNVKGNPNENYAREFFELYTIGRGLEGTLPPSSEEGDYFNFKEQDVQASARVLSGFDTDEDFANIDQDTGLPRGVVKGGTVASSHDNDPKTFSDRFNGTVIQGDPLLMQGGQPTEESALDEIDQLVEMIYAQEETARYICRKIYRYFGYYSITQNIEDTIISEMAQTFISSGFKLQAVLEELFKSEHFYEAAAGVNDDNFGGIIKSPLDLTLGLVRFFEIAVPDYGLDLENFYTFTGNLINWQEDQGLNFYEPFEVAGYAAYHQFPIYNRNWISTNYLTRRYDYIRRVMTTQGMMEPGTIGIDILDFSKTNIPNTIAEQARDLIMEYAKYLLPRAENLTFDPNMDDNATITAERLNYFLFAFLFEPKIDADPESAWTFRWNNGVDDEVVQRQLESLMNAMLQSPEYQLF